MRPQAPPALRSFQCRSCGGNVTLRNAAQTHHVACEFCGSITNAQDPNLALIQKYKGKLTHGPVIQLGKRGTIRGEPYEMIGFLLRTVTVEGTDYSWEEYLLHHPHRGYRWLAQYGGHWNFIKTCTGMPQTSGNDAKYLNMKFQKYQEAEARVTYVLGEFFWEIRRGEKVQMVDYINPPYLLSCEKSEDEVVWSIGEYIRPEEIWKGFELEGSPPGQVGIGPSQPSPYARTERPMRWTFWILLGALVLSQFSCLVLSQNRKVYEETFSYSKADPEHAKVSQIFELAGRTSNVKIVTKASGLSNDWAEIEMALLNLDTGEALDLTREVSYYSGVASGVDEGVPWTEHWTEDGTRDSVLLPSVSSGRYYLWVHPKSASEKFSLHLEVHRDVPRWLPFFLVLPWILVPYGIYLWRRRSFEYRRWLESDYPMPSLTQLPSGGATDDS